LMGIQTEYHVVRKDDALDIWESGRYERSSRRLAGNQIFCLVNCAESSRSTSE